MLWKYKKCYEETNEDVSFSCNEYQLTVEQTDLDAADDNKVYWDFANCVTEEVETRQHTKTGVYTRCLKNETSPIVYIYVEGVPTIAIDSIAVNIGNC